MFRILANFFSCIIFNIAAQNIFILNDISLFIYCPYYTDYIYMSRRIFLKKYKQKKYTSEGALTCEHLKAWLLFNGLLLLLLSVLYIIKFIRFFKFIYQQFDKYITLDFIQFNEKFNIMDENEQETKSPIKRLGSTRKLLVFNSKLFFIVNNFYINAYVQI